MCRAGLEPARPKRVVYSHLESPLSDRHMRGLLSTHKSRLVPGYLVSGVPTHHTAGLRAYPFLRDFSG